MRGLTLRVCTWGAPTGWPVVLCHGWLDQGAAFDALAVDLARCGAFVVAPDHRGHGLSDWTPPGSTYHFMEYVADLYSLMDTLGLRRVSLVGHSMGGTIASLLAGLCPERVDHLVLLDGLGPPSVSTAQAVDQARVFLTQTARPHSVIGSIAEGAHRIQLTNRSLCDSRALALAGRVLRAVDGGWQWTWDPLHRLRAAVAFDGERHKLVLSRIQCPVSVWIAAQGPYAHLSDLTSRLQLIRNLNTCSWIECGHDIHHASGFSLRFLAEGRAQVAEIS